jgi:hypothetical protein
MLDFLERLCCGQSGRRREGPGSHQGQGRSYFRGAAGSDTVEVESILAGTARRNCEQSELSRWATAVITGPSAAASSSATSPG